MDGEAAQRITLGGQPIRLALGWRKARHEVAITLVTGAFSLDSVTVATLSSSLPTDQPFLIYLVLGLLAIQALLGFLRRK